MLRYGALCSSRDRTSLSFTYSGSAHCHTSNPPSSTAAINGRLSGANTHRFAASISASRRTVTLHPARETCWIITKNSPPRLIVRKNQ